jgi:hypothetical protein
MNANVKKSDSRVKVATRPATISPTVQSACISTATHPGTEENPYVDDALIVSPRPVVVLACEELGCPPW